jgi:hypothetical protein
MQRQIPERRPTLSWELRFDFVLADRPPAIGDGKVLLAAVSPAPSPLVVLSLDAGNEGPTVAPPEETWRCGTPNITENGELALPLEGERFDGHYLVRGNASRDPWIHVLEEPSNRPSEPSGVELWALATSAGFVHVPRTSVLEWRFDDAPDRIRSFEELPVAASADVLVTQGVSVPADAASRSPRDHWIYGPTFSVWGGTRRIPRTDRVGRRSSGIESHEFIFRNRSDGARIGQSRAPHLVSIDHRRCVTRSENRLLSEDVQFPETRPGKMEIDAPLVSAAQAPGVLVVVLRRAGDAAIRLQRFRDDGVSIGASEVGARELEIVALDHTRLLYLADGELIAEPLTEPNTTLWRLRLPQTDAPLSLLAARDGFIVAHDRHRVWCWSDRI